MSFEESWVVNSHLVLLVNVCLIFSFFSKTPEITVKLFEIYFLLGKGFLSREARLMWTVRCMGIERLQFLAYIVGN